MGYKFNRDIKMFFLGMHSTALIFLFGAVKQLTVTGGE